MNHNLTVHGTGAHALDAFDTSGSSPPTALGISQRDLCALTLCLQAAMTDEVQNLSPEGQAALDYARAGMCIFPVRPLAGDPTAGKGEPGYEEYRASKAPVTRLVPHGKDDATTDPFQIVAWWTAEPCGRVGVNLERSGLTVADWDGYKGEDQQRQDLPPLPTGLGRTRRSLSPSGGRHDFYLAPENAQTINFRDGELLYNRYVILPSPNSGYRWEDEGVPIAEMHPRAVEALFTVKARTTAAGPPDDEVLAQRYHELRWWLDRTDLGPYRIKEHGDGRIVAELESCPFDPSDHSAPHKAVVGRASGGGWFAKCVVGGCAGQGWEELRDQYPQAEYPLPTFVDVAEQLGYQCIGEFVGDYVPRAALGLPDEDGAPSHVLVLAEDAEAFAALMRPFRRNEVMAGWVRGTDIVATELEWLWDGRLPKGKLVLLAGDGGDGKSFITASITAAITRGGGLPGMAPMEPRSVLIVASEDGADDTLKPRLDRMNADPERYRIRDMDRPITVNDVEAVETALEYMREDGEPVSLLIIDPWMTFLTGNVNTWKDNELRAVVQPWIAMAKRQGVTILALLHLNKGDSKPMYRIMGSIASPALARAALLTGKTPDGKMAVAVTKSNLAQKAPVLEYEIVDIGDPGKSGVVQWGRERPDLTDEDLVCRSSNGSANRGRRDTAVAEAEEFLRRYLADGEWHAANQVMEVADQDGISKAALKRARKNLLVHAEQRDGVGKPWDWRLDPDWELVG